jgi:hypothetical protein
MTESTARKQKRMPTTPAVPLKGMVLPENMVPKSAYQSEENARLRPYQHTSPSYRLTTLSTENQRGYLPMVDESTSTRVYAMRCDTGNDLARKKWSPFNMSDDDGGTFTPTSV